MYRSKIKSKVKVELFNSNKETATSENTLVNKNLVTPENSVRKSLGLTQCRRIGLSRKKVTSSPGFNTHGSPNWNKTPSSSQETWDKPVQEISSPIDSMKKVESKYECSQIKSTIDELEQQINISFVENAEKGSRKTAALPKSKKINQQKQTHSTISKDEQKSTEVPKKSCSEKIKTKKRILEPKSKNSSVKRTISELEHNDKICKKYKLDDLDFIESENKQKTNCDLSSQDDILIGFDSNLISVTVKKLEQEPIQVIQISDRIENKDFKEIIDTSLSHNDLFSNVYSSEVIAKHDKEASAISEKNNLPQSKKPNDFKVINDTKNLVQSVGLKSLEKQQKSANNISKKNDNVPKPESLSIPIDTIKESKKNQNYFCDSDSDFEELTPVSRKICMENRKSEKIDKIKSSTKKNKDKEKRKNEENKKTVLQKDKNSLSQTIEKPLSQLSSNIEESRKNLVRNKSILLDDDDDDIFLPKKTFLN